MYCKVYVQKRIEETSTVMLKYKEKPQNQILCQIFMD